MGFPVLCLRAARLSAVGAKFAAWRPVLADDEVTRGVTVTGFAEVPDLLPLQFAPLPLDAAPVVQSTYSL